jgi:hypothetical protein
VTQLSGREVVERYMRAIPGDFDTVAALRHPDFVLEFPQSGEVIRGHGNWHAAHERYVHVQSETRHVTISILELRDGLVFRGRTYFAAPFAAPEWRAQWVEPMTRSDHANAQAGAGEPAWP